MMIETHSIFGNTIELPREKFTFRISAYGIIIHQGKMLVVNTKSSGKWFFPGGGVDIGETLEDAVHREVFEETGITVKIEKFLTFKEGYFYYDPGDNAWQSYSFFYICKPLTLSLTEENQVELDESENPEWINLKQLRADDFQAPADEIFKMI